MSLTEQAASEASAGGDVPADRGLAARIGLIAGPLVGLLVTFLLGGSELSPEGARTAGVATVMAIWWATEAIPVAATAFLPIVLFPTLGVLPMEDTTSRYAHPVIYLFFGGFVVALAIERCGLHRRIALNMVRLTGTNGAALVAGFMGAAAAISMWIANTSTTLMLVPIALSMIAVVRDSMTGLTEKQARHFATALLLGVAYGATLGGVSTLVGTPPNALMAGFMADEYGVQIDFSRWMLVGVPVALIMLPITWLMLTKVMYKVNFKSTADAKAHVDRLRSELGPATTAERRIGMLFLFLVIGWVFRKPISAALGIEGVTDTSVAMTAALLAFIIPAGSMPGRLMRWRDMKKLPWGVLILFGGGLALAAAMSESGLSAFIGAQLAPLSSVHLAILIVAATAMVILLTELTSNLATTATFLPVMAAIAMETGNDPLTFIIPITLAASCAFMLPVATAPNAIVFSTGAVTIPQMMRAGLLLNLCGVVVLSIIALTLAPMVFG
ncbi:SLC13 family permease [Sphingomicrobium sediminis]|uniref:DASS family sodium-coupled anion symporter n=1 Tax=Sphingomicrobium sediminis TaxID=2950949 RepID=A0A9X2J2Y1_9SPHN|nr:DASS family sodium-coupled anion symporter [Sphingomicrobium sediminis]MCM8558234.1 DASS family sodium-coupled anion symporter [Sphingomicrobium sediminis]